MAIDKVFQEIKNYEQQGLDLFSKMISLRSTSADGIGIKECSKYVCETLTSFGIPAKLYETDLYPIIYGEWLGAGPDALTIIYYGHYDTMPPDPLEEWNSDPFKLTIKDGKAYGRGAADNKGLFVGGLLGLRAYMAAEGKLPINVKVVMDGEEECGSPSIRKFIAENKEMLKADMIFNIDGGYYTENPQLLYGVRGALVVELSLQTATGNNHSGLRGNVIPEASYEMAKVLAALRDENGRIAIPGYFDDVIPPTEKDLEYIDMLPYDPKTLAQTCGVKSIDYSAREYYTRLMFEPTLTINGMGSGYQGEGGMMCIPGNAFAKISMRLALNQDPDDIFEKFTAYIHELNPDVKVARGPSLPPSRTSTDFELGEVVQKSLEKIYEKKTLIIPSDGGSAPDYIWTKVLGAPSIIAPLANDDCKSHGANENIRLDLFQKVPYALAQVINDLGEYK